MLAILLIIASCSTSLVEGVLIKKYNGKHDKGGFIFTAMAKQNSSPSTIIALTISVAPCR